MTREEAIKRFSDLRKTAQKAADEFEETFPRQASSWRKDVELYDTAISALREQETVTNRHGLNSKEKLLESNRICSGCRWKGVRHQKCSCCCRNLYLKDNYEEEA